MAELFVFVGIVLGAAVVSLIAFAAKFWIVTLAVMGGLWLYAVGVEVRQSLKDRKMLRERERANRIRVARTIRVTVPNVHYRRRVA